MEICSKTIPDQKLAIINYKGPMGDLDILVSKLMGWMNRWGRLMKIKK